MTIRTLALGMTLAALLAPAPRLAAQATVPGIWPEKPLAPPQKELKDAVIVLRDTLRAVQATSSRLERAHLSGSSAVLTSSARTLATDCTRASRGATRMQESIRGFSTSEPRGDEVLDKFRRALLDLQRDMTSCSSSVTAALAPKADGDRLTRIQADALKATARYEASVQELMKTLNIPLDPKGHKSAIEI